VRLGPAAEGLRELFQQSLGLSQVRRVEAFGEPSVNLRERLPRFVNPALPLPQAGQAGRRPQFPGLGALAAGHLDGLMQTGLRLSLLVTLVCLFHKCQCLGQCGQSFFRPVSLCLRFGQGAKYS
jgi:hypothetical protein